MLTKRWKLNTKDQRILRVLFENVFYNMNILFGNILYFQLVLCERFSEKLVQAGKDSVLQKMIKQFNNAVDTKPNLQEFLLSAIDLLKMID